MLKVHDATNTITPKIEKLGTGYVKIQVRKRLTADGGKSIMAN